MHPTDLHNRTPPTKVTGFCTPPMPSAAKKASPASSTKHLRYCHLARWNPTVRTEERDNVCLKEKVGHVTFLGTINTGIEREGRAWFPLGAAGAARGARVQVKDAAGAVPARTTLHSVTGSAPLGAGWWLRGAALGARAVPYCARSQCSLPWLVWLHASPMPSAARASAAPSASAPLTVFCWLQAAD
ncbi:unnamed protein product [Spodoptera exigua]|nr:unnamed protein product [Spodoptera exigua]